MLPKQLWRPKRRKEGRRGRGDRHDLWIDCCGSMPKAPTTNYSLNKRRIICSRESFLKMEYITFCNGQAQVRITNVLYNYKAGQNRRRSHYLKICDVLKGQDNCTIYSNNRGGVFINARFSNVPM